MKRLTIMLVIAMLGCVAMAAAVPPPVEAAPGSRVIMDWDEFKAVTDWDEHAAGGDAANRFVLPWTEVSDLLGLEIADVGTAELKLPWREFKALLEWSVREEERKRKEADAEVPAPVPYLFVSAEYVAAELSEEGARFTAELEIEVLQKDGWKSIPVLPAEVAVRKATLPEGVHLQLAGTHYHLLTQAAGTIDATIEFSVAVGKVAGAHSLGFAKVNSGTCVLDVSLPGTDVDVEVPGAQSSLTRADGGNTRVVAALPAEARVQVNWERAVPEADKVPPKLYSETRTLASVGDGILVGRTQISFSILHTPTRSLDLRVPEGVSVLEVTGRAIRDWRVTGSKLVVNLDQETIGAYLLDVKYERALAEGGGSVPVPVITAEGVEREKGHIGVVALTNVEISGDKVEGAHALAAKDLPAEILGMTSQPILLGFRYVTPGFSVALAVDKHPDVPVLLTVVDRALFTIMQTVDGRRIVKGIYNVRNNRNQFLRLQLPPKAELWSANVAGRATQPARDAEGRLLLPLVRSQGSGGMSAFPVELVYVEEGTAPDARGRGTARVTLPTCAEPITHLMASLYVPEQGKYRDFEGSLRNVKAFAQIGVAAEPVQAAAVQVEQLQQAFKQQRAQVVRGAGATPIKVHVPMSGEVYRFEKILVISGEQWIGYSYTGLK